MGYRRFSDRDGHQWEVRDRSRSEWELQPVSGNPHPPRTIRPPSYEADPFELSIEELQRLLDQSGEGPARRAKSPFRD